MAIKISENLLQGTDEWLAARCGLLTASEMKHIITPKYKVANNGKTKMHLYELLAQRITNRVEPCYIGDDMLRGIDDEDYARSVYNENNIKEQAREVGFITNDKWGFIVGYSPDGLVKNNGCIEIKSRKQKFQIQTISSWEVPEEHDIQVQTALLVSEREWIDYIQYSNGMEMAVIRVYPDLDKHKAIIEAATAFEDELQTLLKKYNDNIKNKKPFLLKTERREGAMVI